MFKKIVCITCIYNANWTTTNRQYVRWGLIKTNFALYVYRENKKVLGKTMWMCRLVCTCVFWVSHDEAQIYSSIPGKYSTSVSSVIYSYSSTEIIYQRKQGSHRRQADDWICDQRKPVTHLCISLFQVNILLVCLQLSTVIHPVRLYIIGSRDHTEDRQMIEYVINENQ